MTPTTQDLIVAGLAILAAAWLTQRWLKRRRAKSGCDTCAAAMHAKISANKQSGFKAR